MINSDEKFTDFIQISSNSMEILFNTTLDRTKKKATQNLLKSFCKYQTYDLPDSRLF